MTVDSGKLKVLCAFEDRAFQDVVQPVIERLFDEEGFEAPEIKSLLTHGCRWMELQQIGRDYVAWADLLIVGADTQERTVAQKRKAMEGGLDRSVPKRLKDERLLLALAMPCAEGWLQADLAALKRGVSEVLDDPVSLSGDTGAYPADERGAKARLRTLLDQADVPTLRGGLEFGPSVMRFVEPEREESLSEFVNTLRHWLQRWRRGY